MQDIKDFEPLFGGWEIDEPLGEGSYGMVYKIVKRDMGGEYWAAVKHLSLPKESEPYPEDLENDIEGLKAYYQDDLDKLSVEINLCRKLEGTTNIVSYNDFEKHDKPSGIGYDVFIKMELLTSLPNHIKKGGLSVRDVVWLGEDICKALMVLEQEQIVHRDIKPANIFVNSRGDYKLGDFGISKAMESKASNMSSRGTPDYVAPETYYGDPVSFYTDIYSLGLVLYRMANQNRLPLLPLPPETITRRLRNDALERRLKGEPLPPPVDADGELAEIILKACAYRPEDRWQSAEEMGRALVHYQERMGWSRAAGSASPVKAAAPVAG
ncbi:MAG: serine/threonine protein kinase, partial [Oscillospiraceae bacterium]|nr:serine/threonine protein kinase [Oscillospiraceae bacterium]